MAKSHQNGADSGWVKYPRKYQFEYTHPLPIVNLLVTPSTNVGPSDTVTLSGSGECYDDSLGNALCSSSSLDLGIGSPISNFLKDSTYDGTASYGITARKYTTSTSSINLMVCDGSGYCCSAPGSVNVKGSNTNVPLWKEINPFGN